MGQQMRTCEDADCCSQLRVEDKQRAASVIVAGVGKRVCDVCMLLRRDWCLIRPALHKLYPYNQGSITHSGGLGIDNK
jgi:hypothetical protein